MEPTPPSWPLGSGYPPPPPPEPPGRRSGRLVALGGALVVLFLLAVSVGVLISDDFDDGDDGGTEDDAAAATADTLSEADLAALVDELSGFVEDQRDLTFEEDVDLEVLDSEAYQDRVLGDAEADLEKSREDLENAAGAYQALGYWPPGTDPIEIARRFVAVGSVGFYDDGKMVVLGAADTPNLRVTLVHELTHALDDQHFDLDQRDDLAELDDESASAYTSLVEGNASRVDSAYEATLTDDERAEIVAEQTALLDDVDLSGIPPLLFAGQQATYTDGEAFAQALFDEGGNDAIDAAFEDPPTTSEQILEPEDWPERDPVMDVEVPDADGEALENGVVGQSFLGIIAAGPFRPVGDIPEWDGDNSVLWAEGDEFCLRMAIAGDVEGFEDYLSSWADQADADLVIEDGLLVATACN